MKSQILDIHIILFFDQILYRPDELIVPLNIKLNNLFDNMPNILPVPENAPKEIPVVILTSKDNIYRCNLSRGSIDFSYSPKNIEDFSEVEISFDEKATVFIKTIDEYCKVKIIRAGFVINYFIPIENPTSKITNSYIRKQMGRLDEISIRFNQKNKEGNFIINNVTNLTSTEIITAEGKKTKGILIQRDINNQINNSKLTSEFLIKFIKLRYKDFSKKELDKVVF